MTRIAHLSDLHFGKVTLNPLQFFSKRWLGNFNLFFVRKSRFFSEQLNTLPALFKELGVDHIIISGDLTTTSRHKEFMLALDFISRLKEETQKEVTVVPGNHDHYTQGAFREKRFYHYFGSPQLKEDGVEAQKIPGTPLWIVALDTSLATSWVSSEGCFSEMLEKNLHEALLQIPKEDQVILVNHFPLFDYDAPRKKLIRCQALQKLLRKFPQVKFYLNGHTHRHSLADLRADELPIILDSGCAVEKTSATWNLLDISSEGCKVTVYTHKNEWQPQKEEVFQW